MRRRVSQVVTIAWRLARLTLSHIKEIICAYWRIACIQVKHPNLKCHPTADIRIAGILIVEGPVHIGKNSKIHVVKGSRLEFGGKNMILENVWISPSTIIKIGYDVSIQDDCHILGEVMIGAGTLLAPRVFICSSIHSFRGLLAKNILPWLPIRFQDKIVPRQDELVSIGCDCWVGINSIFLPGSSIGNGCIVGASSIVIGQQPGSYLIYAGSPVRQIGIRWFAAAKQIKADDDFDSLPG
jgi:acetyltransferase-like isoleucine patch superfamily enzyme